MTSVYRPNRKATDEDLIKLNNLGLSLNGIATLLGCHPTTVTQRLKALSIAPADTRRAFMEDIYHNLSEDQRQFLVDELGDTTTIKEYVQKLIISQYLRTR